MFIYKYCSKCKKRNHKTKNHCVRCGDELITGGQFGKNVFAITLSIVILFSSATIFAAKTYFSNRAYKDKQLSVDAKPEEQVQTQPQQGDTGQQTPTITNQPTTAVPTTENAPTATIIPTTTTATPTITTKPTTPVPTTENAPTATIIPTTTTATPTITTKPTTPAVTKAPTPNPTPIIAKLDNTTKINLLTSYNQWNTMIGPFNGSISYSLDNRKYLLMGEKCSANYVSLSNSANYIHSNFDSFSISEDFADIVGAKDTVYSSVGHLLNTAEQICNSYTIRDNTQMEKDITQYQLYLTDFSKAQSSYKQKIDYHS